LDEDLPPPPNSALNIFRFRRTCRRGQRGPGAWLRSVRRQESPDAYSDGLPTDPPIEASQSETRKWSNRMYALLEHFQVHMKE
jgi:hypothetical protein